MRQPSTVDRDAFEKWVNNPHKLNRSLEPGHGDEYEHPWTAGAWAAWQEMTRRIAANPAKERHGDSNE